MIHLGNDISIGYDDQTLQAIQASGGGVATDVDTALQRLAVSKSTNDQSTDHSLSPLTWWMVTCGPPYHQASQCRLMAGQVQPHDSQDGFAALAARSLVLAEMQRNQGTIDPARDVGLSALPCNSIRNRHPILIDDCAGDVFQQDLLDRLNNMEDRYDREVESLGETLLPARFRWPACLSRTNGC